MIGLSVSRCIRDMVEGRVDPNNVEKIIGSTAAPTPERIDRLIADYQRSFWGKIQKPAEELFRKMYAEGRIEQPRLTDGRFPNNTENWVNSEAEILWEY